MFNSCLHFEHINEGEPDKSVSADECEDFGKKHNKKFKFVTQDDLPSGCSYDNANDVLYYNDEKKSDIMCGKQDDEDKNFTCLKKKEKRKKRR